MNHDVFQLPLRAIRRHKGGGTTKNFALATERRQSVSIDFCSHVWLNRPFMN